MKTCLALIAIFAAAGCGADQPTTTMGPGAALQCSSSGKNAWQTYGAGAFVAVNQAIFANVGAELMAHGTTNVGDSFTKIGSGKTDSTVDDGATFEGKLAAFLVYAYGGPDHIQYTDGKTYNGVQDMAMAHAGLGITSAQYDYFITNIVVPSLASSGVPMTDISSCFAPIVTDANFKASIVGQ